MMNHGPISFNRWQRERLNEIRAPTLVIHGFEDAILPLPHGEALSKEIPAASLLTLPGVGHELPGRVWNVALPAILQQTSSS
jgi:pimeloyl-ACP methyl ester carboxylesterase